MNVTSTGAFTYSIPIVVPPGSGGMVPSLSLDYSSQNGDGFEGIGWTLAGLPTITRCPKTMDQDNVHGSVNYDSNDRFCLNGQRLVAISGGYGGNYTEYRTEVDGFTKVNSFTIAGVSGPAYFIARTKSGQVLYFGFNEDVDNPNNNSRITLMNAQQSNVARTWAVERISDTKGNYINVTWTYDQANGQAYPKQVNYTGNDTNRFTPYNSVQFVYNGGGVTRPDVIPAYQAGSLMQMTVLLTEIKTCSTTSVSGCTGSSLISDYKLTYNLATSGATHDELKSVQVCDGTGNCPAQMKTTFGWQGTHDAVTWNAAVHESIRPTNLVYGQVPSPTTLIAGDFNGDGLTDAGEYGYADSRMPPQCPPPDPNKDFTFYYADSSGNFTGAIPDLWVYSDAQHYTVLSCCRFRGHRV